MKRRQRCYILLISLLLVAALFSACGKQEYMVELGIDGYVYVPEKVPRSDGIIDLKIAGDYLYYTQDGGNTVRRLPLADAFPEEGLPDFSKGKTVLNVSSETAELPEDVAEALKEAAESFYIAPEQEEKAESEEIKFWFSLKNFVIDESQRLYYVLEAYFNAGSGVESAGSVLCNQDGDGRKGYKVFWPEIDDLAAGGDGTAYVLASGEIYAVDSEGRRQGAVSVEECQVGGSVLCRELFGDFDGRIYYTIGSNLERKTFEILEGKGGSLKLQETEGFLGSGFDSHFVMPGGNILLYAGGTGQLLYEYDRESGTTKELLCWTDSGFQSTMVGAVAGVTSDKLLVYSYVSTSRRGLYLLTRTSVKDLPERELLVLASVMPDSELEDAVMEFNQNSNRYRITIDSYGAYYSDKEKGWVIPYLDPALISENPPDLVDLSILNISKYAEKDVLVDLYPYLESSSVLSKEDFLENMLEGFTFHEKLVCLSSRFSIPALVGSSEELRDLKSWTMEDLYELAEAYPQREPLVTTRYYWEESERGFCLSSLCSRYYLEEFVDWDKGECSFDSGEFGRMLEWVGQYASGSVNDMTMSVMQSDEERLALEKASLLIFDKKLDIYTLQKMEIRYGEEYSLLGYPSVEGGGYFGTNLKDAIGIIARSPNKEGAWEFLEYYMTREPGIGYYAGDVSGFSTNKAMLQESFEVALTEYSGTRRDVKGIIKVGEEYVDFYAIPQRQADALLEVIEKADFTPLSDAEEMIIQIVTEEAEGYYRGDRSLEEVTALIQNRAELVLKERGGR